MLRHRRGGVFAVGLGALVLGLGLASGVVAVTVGPRTPSIDDILGVWRTTWVEANFDLVTGERSHHKTEGTLTVTKLGPETASSQSLHR